MSIGAEHQPAQQTPVLQPAPSGFETDGKQEALTKVYYAKIRLFCVTTATETGPRLGLVSHSNVDLL